MEDAVSHKRRHWISDYEITPSAFVRKPKARPQVSCAMI
ncbi:hypothetical protein ACVWVY_000381 [Bradyrhizobium sp. URHC0002]|jgi:hypothetical protein